MKRFGLFLALILGLFLLLPTVVRADSDWRVNRFHSDIAMQPDGKIKVTEAIEADFGDVAKHGIFRDIPYQYTSDGQILYTTVDVWSVTRDGKDEEYDISQSSGYVRIKIGDPDVTITGTHAYQITYFASGVLQAFDDYDELYWNVTGNGWEVPIDTASATITLPRKSILQIDCYQGDVGSKDSCQSLVMSPLEARFTATVPLKAHQNLSVSVGYTKGIVPILTVEKPKTTYERIVDTSKQPVSWLLIVVSLVAGAAIPFVLWWRKGRDWSWLQPGMLASNQTASLKSMWSKPQVVAEFTPPEDLRPAQLGLLLDEKVNTLDVTSTIIDLASRGWLTITELPKTWMLGSKDYQLARTDKTTEGLLPYENLLLEKLFKSGQLVKLSSLKNTFYKDLASVQNAVYKDLQSRHYFSRDPQLVRNQYIGLGFVGVLIGVFLVAISLHYHHILLAVVAAIPAVAGLGIMLISGSMPQRTAAGYDMYRRALGYKLFIGTAEKYQQQFFEKENLFNEVLPYAMVLGLTHKFAEAMKAMGYEPAQPGWYNGTSAFNAAIFASNMNSMSAAISSTMASAPSSSGSGGGGFSGGGFGGGGGGSW